MLSKHHVKFMKRENYAKIFWLILLRGIYMNGTGIQEQVINEIIALAKKHSIEKVILFGSRARGDYHRASDIDLAVSGGNIVEFTLDLEELTSTLLTYDVVDMNKNLQAKFRKSIEKEGKFLYEKI